METEFERACFTYCDIVKDLCERLISHITDQENIEVQNKRALYRFLHESHCTEYRIDDERFTFHGSGCSYYISNDKKADWDFGYRSLWCGIDPYKMSMTLRSNDYHDTNYHDAQYIKSKCEYYCSTGKLKLYKDQYYIDFLQKETMRIPFPEEFDRLEIDDGITQNVFERSKIIDRFLRKSNRVYKHIESLPGNINLAFYNKGVKIADIPYNDIAYPDSAVDIMSHQILNLYRTQLSSTS